MKVKGIIHAEFDVDSFDIITKLCQDIGVVDEEGRILAELKDNKIITYWYDEWEEKHVKVLYDQPFDVKYASTLIQLYNLSDNYLKLSDYINNRTSGRLDDYQTVKRLKLERSTK